MKQSIKVLFGGVLTEDSYSSASNGLREISFNMELKEIQIVLEGIMVGSKSIKEHL